MEQGAATTAHMFTWLVFSERKIFRMQRERIITELYVHFSVGFNKYRNFVIPVTSFVIEKLPTSTHHCQYDPKIPATFNTKTLLHMLI